MPLTRAHSCHLAPPNFHHTYEGGAPRLTGLDRTKLSLFCALAYCSTFTTSVEVSAVGAFRLPAFAPYRFDHASMLVHTAGEVHRPTPVTVRAASRAGTRRGS